VGAVHVIFAVRIKWLRVCLSFIIAVYAAYMVFENYTRNDHSRDYLSYDYGNNILATIEPKGVFIGDGDYNLMPVYYIRQMQKKRTDIVFAAGSFLIFDWGIRDFQEKYGNIPMKPYRAEDNIKNIVEAYADGGHVYRSRFMPRMDKLPAAYIMSDKGILISVASKKKVFSPAIYSLYSYRGLFEKFTLEEKNNRDMTGWYPVSMVNQANTLLAEGYPDQAEMLYKRSLLFPVDKPEGNILYNLALACAGQNNTDDELKYLLAAAKKNCSFPAAYERAGIILYNKGMLVEAKDMFVSAAGQGSLSAESGRALEYINSLKTNEAYEVAMIKANNSLLNNDYGHAEELYKYLLEKRYKVAIINRNIGVFHFRTQKYDLAIESFEKSNNDTQDPVTYKYLALTYYKTGRINEALKTVDDGIKIFQNEKQLEQLEVQIKGEINKNEKNSSGTDR
jgi:tetratricopeptide (TPR) repeat protein